VLAFTSWNRVGWGVGVKKDGDWSCNKKRCRLRIRIGLGQLVEHNNGIGERRVSTQQKLMGVASPDKSFASFAS
jgi:hypothetical protein